MAEYIEREAALQFVFDACAECLDTCEEFDGINPDCHQCMLEGVKLKLRDMPTADVQPVRNGRWISHGWSTVCSECGEDYAFAKRNYCPNCGAKTDKEEP